MCVTLYDFWCCRSGYEWTQLPTLLHHRGQWSDRLDRGCRWQRLTKQTTCVGRRVTLCHARDVRSTTLWLQPTLCRGGLSTSWWTKTRTRRDVVATAIGRAVSSSTAVGRRRRWQSSTDVNTIFSKWLCWPRRPDGQTDGRVGISSCTLVCARVHRVLCWSRCRISNRIGTPLNYT